MSYYYKAEEVREKIQSSSDWLSILARLSPDIEPALRKPGRHVRCPRHGSSKSGEKGNGFRVFRDVHETGGGICNTCGPRHDGFELLMWLNGWSFQQCLLAIGDLIGAHKHFQPVNDTSKSNAQQLPNKDSQKRKFRAKGALTDFGQAPFNHDPENENSFFVSLRDLSGHDRTVWGVDLSRALQEAEAEVGDVLTLYSVGRREVIIEKETLNDSGHLETKEIQAKRTEWLVVNRSRNSEKTGAIVLNNAQSKQSHRADNNQSLETHVSEGSSNTLTSVEPLPNTSPEWVNEVKVRLEKQAEQRKQSASKAFERHKQTWDECLPINTGAAYPLFEYFKNRGVLWVMDRLIDSDSIRFHPALPYYTEDSESDNYTLIGKFPAMVGAIRDIDGRILTLHRTYLASDGGKAKVEEVKKMAVVPEGVDINGSAIRLGQIFDGTLGVAEGIETALSAFRATGIPTWSTVNAQLMKSFEVPEGVHTVIIWADKDKSLTGEIAANVLKTRLESQGILVLVMLPPTPIPAGAKSIDWNDVLVEQGRAGFPSRSYILRYCELNRSRAFSKVEYASALA